MNRYYHVTPYSNLDSIIRKGLIPQIGPLSKKQQELHAAVFLFNNEISAEDAIVNWYGDEFDEDTKLAIIQVNIPINRQSNLVYCEEVGYESQYHGVIDPRWLTHIRIA